jgi:hypothetical protein
MSALAPVRRLRVVDAGLAEPAPTAHLAHSLTSLMIAGAHQAAEVNLQLARRLLAPADRAVDGALTAASDAWRFSCRTLQICLTTSAQVLRLVELKADRDIEALWSAVEQQIGCRDGAAGDQLEAARTNFAVLRAAQREYFRALAQAQDRIVALARGEQG